MKLAASVAAAAEAEPYEECAICGHSPAYHDGDGGDPCRAWDPDQPDHKCGCKGWKIAPPAAPPEI